MDPHVIAAIDACFAHRTGRYLLRRKVRGHLARVLGLDALQAESLLDALVEDELLHETQVWYFCQRLDDLVREPGIGLGPYPSGVLWGAEA